MAMTRRRVAAGTAAVAGFLVGCSATGDAGTDTKPTAVTGPVAVEVAWPSTTGGIGALVAGDAKKLFEDRNPGVTVNVTNLGNERPKVLAQTAAGTPPQVLFLDVPLPAFYVVKNMLVPLDGYISKDKESRKEEFAPTLWDAFTIRAKQYALPREGGPTVLYYNKTLVSGGGVAPPSDSWTLAEQYREAAVKLSRPAVAGGLDVIGTETGNFRNWLWSNGGEILDAGMTKYVMDQPAAIDALQLYQDFRYKFRCATTAQENAQQAPVQRFIAGGLALFPGLRSNANPTFVQPHVGITVHPKGKTGRKFGMPGNGLALMQQPTPAQGKALDAAYKAAAWYVSAEFQKMHYKAGIGGVVARLSVLKSEEYLNSQVPREWNEFFARGVSDLRAPPKMSNWPEIDEAITMELTAFQNGQETAAAVTARIAPIVNAMVKEGQK